jgi:RNA polymerase sigma factor (sigma-70 family)
MYGRKVNGELRKVELDEARRGFIQFLRRKRFSPQFIASHGDDLFATAALEYSRKIAQGTEIDSPPGWLITCAWRRTKSLLEAQGRSPRIVSTEKAEPLTDELSQSPEEATLDEDRFRKVQEAVAQLSVEERQLLELAYFEGMAVREAARELHWHPSKAQRCHEAARRRLHDLLGVDSLDELELDVGLAAYVSFIGAGSYGLHLPAGIEAVVETVNQGAAYGWARAQEFARRFPLGGGAEPSTTAALGGTAGRAAGVCATAALACIASGVVGPGVGGVNVLGGDQAKPGRVASAPKPAPVVPSSHPLATPSQEPEEEGSASKAQTGEASKGASPSAARSQRAERAVRSQSLESLAGGSGEVASRPVESASAPEPSAPPSSGSSATASNSTPTQVANEQFGP